MVRTPHSPCTPTPKKRPLHPSIAYTIHHSLEICPELHLILSLLGVPNPSGRIIPFKRPLPLLARSPNLTLIPRRGQAPVPGMYLTAPTVSCRGCNGKCNGRPTPKKRCVRLRSGRRNP